MAKGFGTLKTNRNKKTKKSVALSSINHPQAQNLLQLAIKAHQSGKLLQASKRCQEILAKQPDHMDAWLVLGNIYRQQGKLEQAISAYQKLIQLQPSQVHLMNNLGVLYIQQGQPSKAIATFQQIIKLQPDYAQAHGNLGQLYREQDQLAAAEKHLQQAIELKPDYPEAFYNLGNLYKTQDKTQQAIAAYQQAIKIKPDYSSAYNNLGAVYHHQGNLTQAYDCYQQAIELQPNYGLAYFNLGNVYRDQGKFALALQAYHRVIEIQPDYSNAFANLGNLYRDCGQIDQSLQYFSQVRQFEPDHSVCRQNFLYYLHYSSQYSPEQIYQEHKCWAKYQQNVLSKYRQPHANQRNPEKKIRLGYISGDFRTHSVAYFLEPILTHHNRQQFTICCYANNPCNDGTTDRFKQLADIWHDINRLDDERVADLVREDEIDILVDLSGYTGGNRLMVLAIQPAPVQVTYLGYPDTTGLDTVNYRFTDAWADPLGKTEQWHSEQLIRLPQGFLCYLPPTPTPEVNALPSREKGYITFGSFNNLAKISDRTISCWAKILHAVPQSRLFLKTKPLQDRDICDRIYRSFEQEGINRDRLTLLGWTATTEDHFRLYHQVDLALDTYPYHGTTTTCEAMWMGVPVITLAGQTHVSRVGVSLLSAVGLTGLIASSEEEYIGKAVDLANETAKLSQLRQNIRIQMQSSPLTDGEAIAQSLESAYRQMWRDWCQEQLNPSQPQPEKIDVRRQIKLAFDYYDEGKLTSAIACLQSIQQVQPDFPDAWHLLGDIYRQQGKLEQAISAYQKLIQLQPSNVSALSNLGVLYIQQGEKARAIASLKQALQIQPDYYDAHNNLGELYREQNQLIAAEEHLQQAIQIQPDFAEAHYNLGNVYKNADRLGRAINSFQRAIQLKPNYAGAHNNLGNTYKQQGNIERALQHLQTALKLNPGNQLIHQNLLLSLHYSSQYSPAQIYQEHQNWAKSHHNLFSNLKKSYGDRLQPEKKIRLGYVSGDFKQHSVAYFLEPLLTHHNRQQFTICCYANNSCNDAITDRFKQLADIWHDINRLDDERVADLVRKDEIDILVDLSGHTKGNRLLVFARKPAPIQVTYLGYPNTTGLDPIDYRFTDVWADPPGTTEQWHSEQLIRLPQGFLAYLPPPNAPSVSPLPATKKGYITFGTFNHLGKVSNQSVDCWAKILHQVPRSRLLLKAKALGDSATNKHLYRLFEQEGITRDRLTLLGWTATTEEHLSLYHQIDIALDTYPYHGTTTTCEAMWMGVPVITLAGQTHVSRVGVSLLSAVGLTELIANSEEEYIGKAVNLANNTAKLSQLRQNIRIQMQSSPLTDGEAIAQSLELAYRQMWQKFCDREKNNLSRKKLKTISEKIKIVEQKNPQTNISQKSQIYTFLIEGSYVPIYQRIIKAFTNNFQELGHKIFYIEPYKFSSKNYVKEIEKLNPDFCILTNPCSSIAKYYSEIDGFIFEAIKSKLIFIHHDNIFSNIYQLNDIVRKLKAFQDISDRSYHFCLEYSNFIDLRSLGLPNVYPLRHASEFSYITPPEKYSYQTSFVGHITPDVFVPSNFPYSHLIQADIWRRITNLSSKLEESAIEFAINQHKTVVTDLKFLSLKHFYMALLHKVSQPFRGEIIKRINNVNLDIIGGDPAYLHGIKQKREIENKKIKYHPPVKNYSETKNIYATSKINLNITSLQFDDAVINRVIDIGAVGGFVLTDWKSDLERLTSVSQAISYKTIEELNHKLEYYLHPDHNRERLEIAKTLHEDIKRNCNYQTIVNFILTKINTMTTTKNEPLRIDLGCGHWKPEGFIGVDCSPNPKVDVIADLNKRFPFADNSVEVVRGHDVVEHLSDRIHTMNEIWRIAKPNAIIDILVPSTDGRGAFQDPTHVSFWNINSFRYYCVEYPAYLKLCHNYGFRGAFKIVSIEEKKSADKIIHIHALLQAIK